MARRVVSTAAAWLVCGVVPLCFLGVLWWAAFEARKRGTDFETFWQAGHDVLEGRSPYPALASLPAAAYPKFAPFVYPPLAAFAFAPLSLLPFQVATALFLVLDLAATIAALRLLGIRDWRCYGAACASIPVFEASCIGTISPLLLLAVAAAWRWRDRAGRVGLVVAWAVSAKLFLWPLWLWLVRTRRFGAAALAAAVGVAAVLASWAAIGFGGMRDYPRLLSRLTELEGPHSYSLYALGRTLGLGGSTAEALVYLATAIAVAAAALLVRDDRRALVAAVGISLLATPILWPHYLVLLYVPIALARPRLSPLWLAPLLLWVDGNAWNVGGASIAGALLLTGAVIAVCAGVRLLPSRGAEIRTRDLQSPRLAR